MGELLVARHAQASFGKAEYDELSPLGRRQAGLLGTWLAQNEPAGFDTLACGTMVRQRDTLAAILDAYAAAGRPQAEPVVIAGFDEYDHRDVLAAFVRVNPDHAAVRASKEAGHDLRTVFDFLREGLGCWARGELDAHVREPWSGFRARVRAAVEALDAHSQHGRTLLVTSGGVLAQLAQQALDVPDARALELNLGIRNSALCAFRSGSGGLRLSEWNHLPHLAGQRELWTYY